MRDPKKIGTALIIIGIIFIVVYGVYILAVSENIPYFIRAGIVIAVTGVLILLLSLIKEKLETGMI